MADCACGALGQAREAKSHQHAPRYHQAADVFRPRRAAVQAATVLPTKLPRLLRDHHSGTVENVDASEKVRPGKDEGGLGAYQTTQGDEGAGGKATRARSVGG